MSFSRSDYQYTDYDDQKTFEVLGQNSIDMPDSSFWGTVSYE